MTTNFARHEQFLRIWKLLECLEASRHPVADGDLVAQLKDALGLTSLSPRTLGRDCEFLASCGYPVERRSLPEGRKQGWQFTRQETDGKRWMPREPLTLLEVTAFLLSREQLRFVKGTVLWSGMESLWDKINGTLPEPLAGQVAVTAAAWHVAERQPPAYASRPRLISLLCAAVADCREVELTLQPPAETPAENSAATDQAESAEVAATAAEQMRFQPHGLAIHAPRVGVVGFPVIAEADGEDGGPLLIDLVEIASATPCDRVFEPCGETVTQLVARSRWTDGTPVT